MFAGVRTLSTAALLACLAYPAAAQDVPLTTTTAPPPANLAFVDGGVDLIHDGVAERASAGTMLVDGDLVRTLNGRAEIVFADGTLLHLDYGTELELLSPVRLRLLNGRVSMRVSASATPYTIDTHAASVRVEPRGEYGITADGRAARLELTVTRGLAEVDEGGVRTVVRGGEMASILGAGGRVILQQFNSARWDAFERWSNDRANGFASAGSARALPYELRPYGNVLDSYGRWDYVAPYGNVWFPAVGVDWRPYYTGAWRRTRYGWTWIGHDPWSWPTHHFGRWGFNGIAWYWIPARVWGPAWVSWSFSPGYVSWCPLGWDGRAVVGYTHVSSWLLGRRGDHPDYRPHYTPWRAWTVIPRDHFDGPSARKGNRPVRTHAIDPDRLPEETRRVMAGYAVPRETVAPALPAADARVPARSYDAPRGAVRTPGAIPSSPGEPSSPSAPSSPSEPSPPSRPTSAPGYTPRVYTPPVYAMPRTERVPDTRSRDSGRQERAEAPPPPPRRSDGDSDGGAVRRGGDGGGRVRSPQAAPRDSGESRAAPPPRSSGRSEGQSQGSGGGGGAVRRRP